VTGRQSPVTYPLPPERRIVTCSLEEIVP
jgi:hypothetical protein